MPTRNAANDRPLLEEAGKLTRKVQRENQRRAQPGAAIAREQIIIAGAAPAEQVVPIARSGPSPHDPSSTTYVITPTAVPDEPATTMMIWTFNGAPSDPARNATETELAHLHPKAQALVHLPLEDDHRSVAKPLDWAPGADDVFKTLDRYLLTPPSILRAIF